MINGVACIADRALFTIFMYFAKGIQMSKAHMIVRLILYGIYALY